MTLTQLLPLKTWKALEREIHERFGLNAAVNDASGKRITDWANWGNELCPAIKGDPGGLAAICAPTGQHCTRRLLESGEAFVEECDAGMLKIIVPVRVDGEVVGCAGGCGAVAPSGEEGDSDGEVETFLVAKSTPLTQEEADRLAETVPVMTRAEADEAAAWIAARLDELLAGRGM